MVTPQSLNERVVLVVDDEDLVRHLTARILGDAGFRVLEAQSGEEAVALLDMLPVELVVSDIGMPRMGGVELAARMADRWPDVPVLLISGEGTPTLGYAGPFLPKPFTPTALRETVAGLVPTRNREART